MTLGPVQLLVVGFAGGEFKGEIMAELERLRDADIVRLVDLVFVRKHEDGMLERIERTDLSESEMAEFGATVGALIGFGFGGDEDAALGAEIGAEAGAEFVREGRGDADTWFVDDTIPPGTAAAVALIEHRWALPLREAIRNAGGFHLADAWIHPADLVGIGMLAAEEAEAELALAAGTPE